MTEPLTVPPTVVSAVQARWPAHTRDWPTHVEAELLELCERYEAKPREVLPARYGFVVAADTADGGIVLRASADPRGPTQAEVARALAKLGAGPTVHEAIVTDDGTWTVLDEVRPGTPLAMTDLSTVSLEALAVPLASINGQPAPIPGMPSIIDWLRTRLEDDELDDLAPGTTVSPTASVTGSSSTHVVWAAKSATTWPYSPSKSPVIGLQRWLGPALPRPSALIRHACRHG